MTGVVAAGEPFKVFGLFPMTLINYSSTFLPILLIVAVQALSLIHICSRVIGRHVQGVDEF